MNILSLLLTLLVVIGVFVIMYWGYCGAEVGAESSGAAEGDYYYCGGDPFDSAAFVCGGDAA